MGTGSWTKRSGIVFSTRPAAELPCEILSAAGGLEEDGVVLLVVTMRRFPMAAHDHHVCDGYDIIISSTG